MLPHFRLPLRGLTFVFLCVSGWPILFFESRLFVFQKPINTARASFKILSSICCHTSDCLYVDLFLCFCVWQAVLYFFWISSFCALETCQHCEGHFWNHIEHWCKHLRLLLLGHTFLFLCVSGGLILLLELLVFVCLITQCCVSTVYNLLLPWAFPCTLTDRLGFVYLSWTLLCVNGIYS